jgi:hypothetical protein
MRTPPALVTQREFRRAHGDKLAADLDLNKLGYPIINHRDGIYWVVDGQHRVYALRQNGFEKDVLDCEVYEGLSDEEMAEIFLGRDERKPVPVYDKFHVACTAGRKRERDILRAVESNGQKVTRNNTVDGGISAVSAIGVVYDQSGDVVLGQVIRAINLGFGGDPMAFDSSIIQGLGLVFNRYNGKTNEKTLGNKLSELRHGPRELLRKAEALRERTGNQKKQCIAAAVVDVYNKGLGPRDSRRLPTWWKE